MRGLGQVSYIDKIENLNISTEVLLNEKLPSQVVVRLVNVCTHSAD